MKFNTSSVMPAKAGIQLYNFLDASFRWHDNLCTKIFKIILIFSLAMFISSVNAADAENIQQRYYSFISEIRCVVCQGQSIADSNAPLAEDLRHKIYTMMLQNESDEEIKQYLAKRYGEFILLRPRFTLTTALLWLFPFFGLSILAYVLVLRHLRSKNTH